MQLGINFIPPTIREIAGAPNENRGPPNAHNGPKSVKMARKCHFKAKKAPK